MIERRKIVDLWQRGDAAAMVTLVRVEGSSYRREGARLLIAANGEYAGSISGGCLEAEVIRKAAWLVRDGATTERYSTLFDDTAEIPYGLGCGGTVDLLLEPAGTPEFTTLMQALAASLQGESFVMETILPSGGKPLRRTVQTGNWQLATGDSSSDNLRSQAAGAFVEVIAPPQRLLIFGAGDDVQPMVRMAALLGWNVVVADGRPQLARADRFPEAERVLAVSSVDAVQITANDAAVIMSHSYEQDRAWLAALLPLQPRYLGLLGARHRSALLVAEAAAILGWDVSRACEGLFAPVGLDLGGDGAEAIALATIAEIQACCEGKLGVSRRLTAPMIAEQLAAEGASRYLQAQCAL
jgi:xanthine/CO dehydrogenase XdhC/CoxF family maturation factor